MTLAEHAKEALEVQNACNLSGVVHAFSRAMDALWAEAYHQNKGTEFVNQHPIVTMFLSKLACLNRGYYECDYMHASEACEALARGEVVEYSHTQVSQ